jgi:hypothetical protein
MADPVLEGRLLAVEAGGQVVAAWMGAGVPMGGMAGCVLGWWKRLDLMRKGT